MKSMSIMGLALFFALSSQAATSFQTWRQKSDRKMSVGYISGLTSSIVSVSGSKIDTGSASLFYKVGVTSEFQILKGSFLYFNPELVLTKKGSSDIGSLTYLEIPLLLKAKKEVAQNFSIGGLLGPNLGINVGEPRNADANAFNFSVDFGAEAEYKISNLFAPFINLRYSLGTTNTIDTGNKDISVRVSSLEFLLGGRFEI